MAGPISVIVVPFTQSNVEQIVTAVIVSTKDDPYFSLKANRIKVPGGLVFVNTLNDCMNACSSTLGCVDVSWVAGSPGPCYLKSAAGPVVPNSKVWGGRQLSKCGIRAKLHRKRVAKLPFRNLRARDGVAFAPDYTFVPQTTTVTTTPSYVITVLR